MSAQAVTPRGGGRPPKFKDGSRATITVRYPEDHKPFFLRDADELGLPLGDYFAYMTFRAKGLTPPQYIVDQIDAATAEREAEEAANGAQEELFEATG